MGLIDYINEHFRKPFEKEFLNEYWRNSIFANLGRNTRTDFNSREVKFPNSLDMATEEKRESDDTFETIFRGYKKLTVHKDGFLSSPSYGEAIWEGKPPKLIAECHKNPYLDEHPKTPDKNCSCGIYSVKEPYQCSNYNGALVEVLSWGRIIPGTQGFRASHARVEGIIAQLCQQENCYEIAEGIENQKYTCPEHCSQDVIPLDFIAGLNSIPFVVPEALYQEREAKKYRLKKKKIDEEIAALWHIELQYMDEKFKKIAQEKYEAAGLEVSDTIDVSYGTFYGNGSGGGFHTQFMG